MLSVFHPKGVLLVHFTDNAPTPPEDLLAAVAPPTATEQSVSIAAAHRTQPWAAFAPAFQIVQAAGGIVWNGPGELLLIHRLGHWDLPKGKVDPGEDFPTAALREVTEETGVAALHLGEFLATTYHCYNRAGWVLKPTHWYTMRTTHPATLHPQAEEGIAAVEWTPIGLVQERLPKFFPAIQALLRTHVLPNRPA